LLAATPRAACCRPHDPLDNHVRAAVERRHHGARTTRTARTTRSRSHKPTASYGRATGLVSLEHRKGGGGAGGGWEAVQQRCRDRNGRLVWSQLQPRAAQLYVSRRCACVADARSPLLFHVPVPNIAMMSVLHHWHRFCGKVGMLRLSRHTVCWLAIVPDDMALPRLVWCWAQNRMRR